MKLYIKPLIFQWLFPIIRLKKGEIQIMIRKFVNEDIGDMVRIWNEVVEEGIAFP